MPEQPVNPTAKRFFFGGSSAVLGAAFLMANSSIGPGFLMQTTTFTRTLLAGMGFVILVSILLCANVQQDRYSYLSCWTLAHS